MKKYFFGFFIAVSILCYANENLIQNKFKILICSPINRKPRILKEFLDSLKRLEKESYTVDYFFIDHNNIEESQKLLNDFKKETNCQILKIKDDTQYNCDEVQHYWNNTLINKVATFKDHMLLKALNDNYDYVFLIDSDVVLHPTTLKQLLSANKDIISNIYWTKTSNGSMSFPQVWVSDEYKLYKHQTGEKLTAEQIRKRKNDFFNMLQKPGIYEVGGLKGCTLISKTALKKGVSFQKIRNLTMFGEDRHFCIRAVALGVPLYVDTHFPSYHIYRDSDLEGVEQYKNNCNIDQSCLVQNKNYPAYKDIKTDKSKLWYFMESNSPGSYLSPYFLKHVDKNKVSSILEIGSRDLKDAIDLSEYFKCHVFSFECNPECLNVCKINERRSSNVTLVEMAVWDVTGTISFYPTIHEAGKTSDPGSSSCFKMTENTLQKYSQTAIEVPAIRLDDWVKEKRFENIDLICMDTQGATLKILQSMGDFLKKTKYIITECETYYHYENECLLPELVSFLNDKGFELIPTEMQWDYLFVNKELN